ncbi:MAG: MotA/TolQ/ExbB proton channel family protein [Phycisphaerae bacterium]
MPLADTVNILREVLNAGPIAWMIVALSVVLAALALARLLSIRHSTLCPEELYLHVTEHVEAGQLKQALELTTSDPSSLGVVLETVIKARALPPRDVRQAAADAAAEQYTRLSQRIGYISLIAAVAPMLGLLGTVSGMIRAFATMSSGQALDPPQLAGAISEALITTYLGLTVAIPALVIHTVLRHRATNIVLSLTALAEQLAELLARSKNAPRNAAGQAPAAPFR